MALANSRSDILYFLATLGGKGPWVDWMEKVAKKPLVFSVLTGHCINIREIVRMVRAIRLSAPDILYVVGVRAAVLVRILKPLLGPVKIVHGIRTTFRRGSLLARKFFLPEFLLSYFTDAYISNSEAGAQSLITLFRVARRKLYVIPNGITIPPVVLGFRGNRTKTVVSVANLHPLKGHKEFLEVVELVHARHPDAKFCFIGRDETHGEIERLANSRGLSSVVEFAGFQQDVWPWLVAARIFVLPSRDTEGSPTAILEALGAGLPAVAFAIGGVPALILDGVDGRVVAPLASSAMAHALIELLDDIPLATKMGEMGREKIVKSFSLQTSANRHAELWRALLP
jgi:glycosyltransferase involved in cell wall biosynthesis